MADMTAAQRASYEVQIPQLTGPFAINAVAISTTAGELNLNATWGTTSNRIVAGGAWWTFEAIGADAFLVVKPASSAVTLTQNAGRRIPAGESRDYWITRGTPFLEHLGSAAGTLKVGMSSRNIDAPTP